MTSKTNINLVVHQESVHSLSEQPYAILLAGSKIVGFLTQEQSERIEPLASQVIDAAGCVIVPGLVDVHVHLIGGGGEAGPASRTPECQLSNLLNAGITTVVGVLGTDCIFRRQEALVAKCRALRAEGITAFHWAGSYRVPPATLFDSVQRDMCFVESCVGVGEVAVSDHRSSAPTPHELARIASEARVGGMLSGKAGLVHVHMGAGPTMLQPLREALALSDVPIAQFWPTHMDRNEPLLHDGLRWIEEGGCIDFTAGDQGRKCVATVFREHRSALSSCSVSSDACGSLPVFDEHGKLLEYKVAEPRELLQCLQDLVLKEKLPLEAVLPLFTQNPAKRLKLHDKGQIAMGKDADLLLLDKETLDLRYVVALGQVVKTPEWTKGGAFERGPHIRPHVLPTE
ncbi:g9957 [Coccomyxa elongata]